MASLGIGNYVVVVQRVGGSTASCIKLVLQREPRTCKTWFTVCSICLAKSLSTRPFTNCLRKIASPCPSTILRCGVAIMFECPSLHARKSHLIYVFLAFVHVPYVISNLRTPAKVEHAVTDGSFVVSTTIDIDGLSLTPSKIGLAKEAQRQH
jgi:hypothetical protein